jgi:mannose-6-phosphate isomerase-like protein (cupin superfamily)
MADHRTIIDSGLLELFAMGSLEGEELKRVQQAIKESPEVKAELREIEIALELYASLYKVDAEPTNKPLLLAQANYISRLEAGEKVSSPPDITTDSKVEDYKQWLDKEYLQKPPDFAGMHGYIIGATEEKTTLIVWLEHGAPDEIHTDELESFLIVEGTCNIIIGDETVAMKAGDTVKIPLHISHRVEVTSDIPCKVILERKAA